MNARSLRFLTWATVVVAVMCAALLVSEDSALPLDDPFSDENPSAADGWQAPPASNHRWVTNVPAHRTRDVDGRRREARER